VILQGFRTTWANVYLYFIHTKLWVVSCETTGHSSSLVKIYDSWQNVTWYLSALNILCTELVSDLTNYNMGKIYTTHYNIIHDSWVETKYDLDFGLRIEIHGIKKPHWEKALWTRTIKMWSLELGFCTWIPNSKFLLKWPFVFLNILPPEKWD